MGNDILVIGAGAVGAYVVEFLARRKDVRGVVVVDSRPGLAEGVAWRARLGALQEGIDARVQGWKVDAAEVDAVEETVRDCSPGVVLHTATILTVRELAQRLPPDTFARIRATGMAGFLPAHLYLGLRVQKALDRISPRPLLVTVPFPDFTNQILARCGPAPVTGIGNVDNVASELQAMAASTLGVPPAEATVMVVASHTTAESFQRKGAAGAGRCHARVFCAGTDVTDQLDIANLMRESARRMQAVLIEARVASSAIKIALGLVAGDGRLVHGAGPLGLPGGWPLRLSAGEPEIALPPTIDHAGALAINIEGQRLGGLTEVASDGTMILEPRVTTMMREEFGVQLDAIPVDDIEDTALALRAALDRRVAASG